MTDFETHPVGTAYLVKRLRAYEGEGFETTACYNGLRSEAADSIEQLEAAHRAVMEEHDYTAKRLGHAFERIDRQAETIDKLTARANAATAAAYEVAAMEAELWDGNILAYKIRALATPDQTAALDKLIAEAVKPYAEALAWYGEQSRLARLIHSEGDAGRNALQADGGKRADAILAASKKGGV